MVCVLAALAAFALPSYGADAPAETGREQLIRKLNAAAFARLDERERAVARIQTRAAAEQRKAQVREKILRLIGGLPGERGPLAVREAGTLARDGFRIERILYQSLPGFWVTANVYVPAAGAGPFPAVVLTPGHSPTGKAGEYGLAANLARNGMIAFAYDPIGEGERLQYFDPATGTSKLSRPTGEHAHASVQTMLIGEHIARYFVWDAMRGIDYLSSRKDVDASRIGAFGCSGGGTVTAYLAALDDRVQAAASACYITSFRELLPSATGVQEAEQSIPGFIEEGLDFADWIEVAAPRPYAVVSTTEDMFPFAGARQTVEEAKRIYGLYGAADRFQWITGPGRHGALGPVFPDILAFFARWLKAGGERQAFTRLTIEQPKDLLCTPTGQVSTSVGGETVTSLNRKRAAALPQARPQPAQVRDAIRSAAGVTAKPGSAPPAVTVTGTAEREGYRLETISLHSEEGIDLRGAIAVPKVSGPHAAVLLLDAGAIEARTAGGGDLDRLARSGRIVLALQPRPAPEGTEEPKSPLLGGYYLLSLRAMLTGRTITGMRTDDTIRALDWLCARQDVDRGAITACGSGASGVVLLHAAALDPRVARVVAVNTLASFRMIVDAPLHRNVSEVVIPGVLRRYDAGDLVRAVGPRPVTFVNPVDAFGDTVPEAAFREAAGAAENVRYQAGEAGAPLPVE